MLILGLRNVYFLNHHWTKYTKGGGSFNLLKWCIDNKKDSKLTNENHFVIFRIKRSETWKGSILNVEHVIAIRYCA